MAVMEVYIFYKHVQEKTRYLYFLYIFNVGKSASFALILIFLIPYLHGTLWESPMAILVLDRSHPIFNSLKKLFNNNKMKTVISRKYKFVLHRY